MSRPELLASLREATPSAPPRLQARIRLISSEASLPSTRRWKPGWRLSLAAAAALVAVAALGATLLPQSSGPRRTPFLPTELAAPAPRNFSKSAAAPGHAAALAPGVPAAGVPAAGVGLPGPSATRAQRYAATLRLRLADASAVAAAAREAVRIAEAIGGYPQTVQVSVGAKGGTAHLVLRVPRVRVASAIGRFSALGTVVGEHVSISDLQAGIDTTGVRIVRLERALAAAINGPQTAQSRKLVASLTAEVVRLQRSRSDTLRSAQDATVNLSLATPARHPLPVRRHHREPVHHGPFHELGVAFRFVGIGAVYVLALGTPLAVLVVCAWLVASRLRRRREERLLSRS